ncbi:MAG: hypothetical protein LBT80_08540 [Lactobacillaceae bacterium]|nr:hypothetical protein [Lactobacillaceae bacterium]
MINRQQILTNHSPKVAAIDYKAPLTVGNSAIAFTVDPTGVQTFADAYAANGVPLCTLSNWGWNATTHYTLADLTFAKYTTGITGREVTYPTEIPAGEEAIYAGLRESPHRLNLIQVRFLSQGQPIEPEQIKVIEQRLNLATGEIFSEFEYAGHKISVKTFVGQEDAIGVQVTGGAHLQLELRFPYSSPKMDASDWTRPEQHQSKFNVDAASKQVTVQRHLDTLDYQVGVTGTNMQVTTTAEHAITLAITSDEASELLINFNTANADFATQEIANQQGWQKFWQTVGFFEVENQELQRRIVLSQYLLQAQCAGVEPPQETGLTVNSWSGKFHLEMTLWHEAWLALYNQTDTLAPLLAWYHNALPAARKNAQSNGYQGARWMKQIGPDLVDSPSPISPLIIWQQPHVIVLLEMLYQAKPSHDFLKEHWILVKESTDFMLSFLAEQDGKYHLESPLFPSQERFGPNDVLDPTFELEYWHYGLQLAVEWAQRLDEPVDWATYADQLANSDESQPTYVPVKGASEINNDHPSHVGIYGLVPTRMDKQKVAKTLETVMANWDRASLWGWDYPMLAMVASRLGDYDAALDILLLDEAKNSFLVNGHNYQNAGLPLYLPGNGALLLAMARIATDFPARVTTENVKTINF